MIGHPLRELLRQNEAAARETADSAVTDREAVDVALQFGMNRVLIYTELLRMVEGQGQPLVREMLETENRRVQRLLAARESLAAS